MVERRIVGRIRRGLVGRHQRDPTADVLEVRVEALRRRQPAERRLAGAERPMQEPPRAAGVDDERAPRSGRNVRAASLRATAAARRRVIRSSSRVVEIDRARRIGRRATSAWSKSGRYQWVSAISSCGLAATSS